MGVANSVHLVSDLEDSKHEAGSGAVAAPLAATASNVTAIATSIGASIVAPIGAPAELPSAKWHVITARSVVDSHSQNDLINEIRSLIASGAKRIAVDLKHNRFLSLPAINACAEAAAQLATKEKNFALISCQERTKRHFEIYGSLKHIHVTRYESDLNL